MCFATRVKRIARDINDILCCIQLEIMKIDSSCAVTDKVHVMLQELCSTGTYLYKNSDTKTLTADHETSERFWG
jgi:hypothetical protein